MSVADLTLPQHHSTQKNDALWDAYQQQKAQTHMLFPLEGAKQLKVSEFELMLASPHSVYLGNDCKGMLHALSEFEQVESIVRNELAVHEKRGRLENLNLGDHMGIALNVGGLDLRFFMRKWQHILAVTDESKTDSDEADKSSCSYSIQFFDDEGRAICKVFLRDDSDTALHMWQDLVTTHANACQYIALKEVIADINTSRSAHEQPTSLWQLKTLADDKRDKLQRKWLALTDIHHFHMLLKSLDIDRASSYHQAPEGMAIPLTLDAIQALLLLVKDRAKPIMTFVGNSGMVQIQTGVVHKVKRMGDWINILDKEQTDFTLHLKDKALAQIWCVKRPSKNSIVTCIEGFDAHGTSIISFFGQRQEGEQERDYWQQITADLVEQYSSTD